MITSKNMKHLGRYLSLKAQWMTEGYFSPFRWVAQTTLILPNPREENLYSNFKMFQLLPFPSTSIKTTHQKILNQSVPKIKKNGYLKSDHTRIVRDPQIAFVKYQVMRVMHFQYEELGFRGLRKPGSDVTMILFPYFKLSYQH